MGEWFFDCPMCGHIGRAAELQPHPTRPSPMDLGFCPKCGGEVEEMLDEGQVRELLADYGDDADAFFAATPA